VAEPNDHPSEAPTHSFPTREELAAAEEALFKDPLFQQLVARLANLAAIARAVRVGEKEDPVDAGVQTGARELGARLMLVAFFSDARAVDINFARKLIDTGWKSTPVLVKEGDRYVPKLVPKAEPWQIVLTTIFQVPIFVRHMALAPGQEPSKEQREAGEIAAVAEILQRLALSGVTLHPSLEAAVRHLREQKPLSELPSPTREQVGAAARFLGGLTGEPLGPPNEGKVEEFRVRWDGYGGRGAGRKLSPWGAASEFAGAFRAPMAGRMHDKTRVK
jgi:hypothetical protein